MLFLRLNGCSLPEGRSKYHEHEQQTHHNPPVIL
jgi:hypothetical protein